MITHVNPDDLYDNPVFSQGTIVPAGRTLYIGGQNGVGPDGQVIEGGAAEQSKQALRNVLSVLRAAGAGPEHVAKLTVYLAETEDVNEAFAATREVWTQRTAVSVLLVPRFARPGILVEIEGVATLP